VVVVRTDPEAWTESGAWWEVGVPYTAEHRQAKARQIRYLNG
jgi:3D-(3,5/4)-trihydroxycyclohexane-1,2-dione acylhydrolase (decyclizing)